MLQVGKCILDIKALVRATAWGFTKNTYLIEAETVGAIIALHGVHPCGRAPHLLIGSCSLCDLLCLDRHA